MQHKPRRKSVPSESAIVAKAALRAADRLDVTNKLLAKILGVSEATISRMRRGEHGGLARQQLEETSARVEGVKAVQKDDRPPATAPNDLKIDVAYRQPIGARR